MKFEAADVFLADFRRLKARERDLFMKAVEDMNRAYDRRGKSRLPRWPAHLRVRDVEGAPGIWEMTWSFAGPDGHATFEFVEAEGEPAIRWRRSGGHEIFSRP
jgi:hypothetical protein